MSIIYIYDITYHYCVKVWAGENDRKLVHAHLKLVIGDKTHVIKGRFTLSLDISNVIICTDGSTGGILYTLDLTNVTGK